MENFSFSKPRYRAIIIGAGISGLQIADLLQEDGFEVTILEAKDQVGGRIRENRTFADFPIELGAEEVHGEESPHYKITQEFQAELVDESQLNYYIEFGDQLYHQADLISKHKEAERVLNIYNEISRYEGKEEITMAEFYKKLTLPEDLYHVIEGIVEAEFGSDLDYFGIIANKNWQTKWKFGKKNFLLKKMSHYEIMTQKFANVMPKVQLNTPVSSINYGLNKEVIVETTTGKTFTADLVVVSIPISQLKKESIKFVPALPEKKKLAINKLCMVTVMKVFLKFKTKFWTDDFGMLITKGNIKLTWPSSCGGKSEKCHVLTSLISGKVANKLAALPDDQIAKELLQDLKRVYGNQIEEELDGYLVQNWGKEEFIEGGYSFPHLNEDEDTRRQIAEPVLNRVFFVGEATSWNHSTISGAIESSYSAFRIIHQNFREKKKLEHNF